MAQKEQTQWLPSIPHEGCEDRWCEARLRNNRVWKRDWNRRRDCWLRRRPWTVFIYGIRGRDPRWRRDRRISSIGLRRAHRRTDRIRSIRLRIIIRSIFRLEECGRRQDMDSWPNLPQGRRTRRSVWGWGWAGRGRRLRGLWPAAGGWRRGYWGGFRHWHGRVWSPSRYRGRGRRASGDWDRWWGSGWGWSRFFWGDRQERPQAKDWSKTHEQNRSPQPKETVANGAIFGQKEQA